VVLDSLPDATPGWFGPRSRVAYLFAVGVGCFLIRDVRAVLTLLALQITLWFVVRLPVRRLLRRVYKLWGFALFVVLSYGMTADGEGADRWEQFVLLGRTVSINVGGLATGALMFARVFLVILASDIVRAGEPKAIAEGLRAFKVSPKFAATLDSVLALMGEVQEQGRGRRGTGAGGGGGGGFWAAFKRIARGDLGPIAARLETHIEQAVAHSERQGTEASLGKTATRDLAVVAGITLSMLGIKALKILPGLPFAPGHKLVLLTPLYIVAALLTTMRWGATLTGLTMGVVSFLLGDGKYGIFELLKHLTPGILCDLMVPLLVTRGRNPGPAGWALFGGLIALGRFATILAMTFLIQAPAVAYAILIPGLTIHLTFGVLSGWMSHHLVRAVARLRADSDEPTKEAA
jgi:hypothetical protein